MKCQISLGLKISLIFCCGYACDESLRIVIAKWVLAVRWVNIYKYNKKKNRKIKTIKSQKKYIK